MAMKRTCDWCGAEIDVRRPFLIITVVNVEGEKVDMCCLCARNHKLVVGASARLTTQTKEKSDE